MIKLTCISDLPLDVPIGKMLANNKHDCFFFQVRFFLRIFLMPMVTGKNISMETCEILFLNFKSREK